MTISMWREGEGTQTAKETQKKREAIVLPIIVGQVSIYDFYYCYLNLPLCIYIFIK